MTRYSSTTLPLTRSCPHGLHRRPSVLDPSFRNTNVSKFEKKRRYYGYNLPVLDIEYKDDLPKDVEGLDIGPEQMQLIAEELDSIRSSAVQPREGDVAPCKTPANREKEAVVRNECSGDAPLRETDDAGVTSMFQHCHVIDSKSTFARIDRYVNRARIAVGLLLAFFWFTTFALAVVQWLLQPPEETTVMMVLRLIRVPFDYLIHKCSIILEWVSREPKETVMQRAFRKIRTCYRNTK